MRGGGCWGFWRDLGGFWGGGSHLFPGAGDRPQSPPAHFPGTDLEGMRDRRLSEGVGVGGQTPPFHPKDTPPHLPDPPPPKNFSGSDLGMRPLPLGEGKAIKIPFSPQKSSTPPPKSPRTQKTSPTPKSAFPGSDLESVNRGGLPTPSFSPQKSPLNPQSPPKTFSPPPKNLPSSSS